MSVAIGSFCQLPAFGFLFCLLAFVSISVSNSASDEEEGVFERLSIGSVFCDCILETDATFGDGLWILGWTGSVHLNG